MVILYFLKPSSVQSAKPLPMQIMEVDRILVLPGGLPLQNGTFRHAMFGEDGHTVFPGIHDLGNQIERESQGGDSIAFPRFGKILREIS